MNIVQKSSEPNFGIIESVILQGDLSKLTHEQRTQYVSRLCEVMGLNPLTKPFEFMTLQGRMICYAGKNCAEQLRKIYRVSLHVSAREKIEDIYIVTVEASLPNGRVDSATGVVPLTGLKGDMLANAMMKAETKAKRRATLSICSLGMLDETEIEDADPGRVDPERNPPIGDGFTTDEYCVPYGPMAKKPISKCDPVALREFIMEREAQYAKSGKPYGEWFIELLKHAEPIIAAFENQGEK